MSNKTKEQIEKIITSVDEMIASLHKEDISPEHIPMIVYYTAQALADAVEVPVNHVLGAVFDIATNDQEAVEEPSERLSEPNVTTINEFTPPQGNGSIIGAEIIQQPAATHILSAEGVPVIPTGSPEQYLPEK